MNSVRTIVCLCGSTRFKQVFDAVAERETLNGKIVLSVNVWGHLNSHVTSADKLKLDELHLRKIDLADEVMVLNLTGYVGLSTRREAWYAQRQGKKLRFLEPVTTDAGLNSRIIDGDDLRAYIEAWFDGWDAWAVAAKEASR